MSPPYMGLPSTAFTATAATSAFLDAIISASEPHLCRAPSHHTTALFQIAAPTGHAPGARITSTAMARLDRKHPRTPSTGAAISKNLKIEVAPSLSSQTRQQPEQSIRIRSPLV